MSYPEEARNPWEPIDTGITLGAGLLAFALRWLHLEAISQNDPLFDFPFIDARAYHEVALEMARGVWPFDGPFFQSPLYPIFLSAIYRFTGNSIHAAIGVQIVMGAVTVMLLAVAARHMYGRIAMATAGLLSAFCAPFIYYEGLLMKEAIGIFFMSAFLATVAYSLRSVSFPGFFFSGLFFGVAILSRGNLAICAPFVLYGLYIAYREWAWPILFAAGIGLVIVPNTIHNVIQGEFIVVTGQGGQNFFIGFNDYADGASGRPPELRRNPEFEQADFRKLAELDVGRELSDKEVARYWWDRGAEWIRNNPSKAQSLVWRKFRLFFGAVEIPDNRDMNFYSQYSSILQLTPITWAVILPLAICGMIVGFYYFPAFAALYLILPAYVGTCLMFHVYSRYRQIVIPLLILFASYVPVFLYHAIRERSPLAFAVIPGLALGGGLVMLNTTPYNPAQQHYNIGYGLTKKGEQAMERRQTADATRHFQAAREAYKRAISHAPDYAEAKNNLATLNIKYFGDLNRAEELLLQATSDDPRYAEALLNLGVVLVRQGKNQEAEEKFLQAAGARENYYKARFNLGLLYTQERRFTEAVYQLEEAVSATKRLGEEDLDIYYQLAKTYEEMNDFGGALNAYMSYRRLAREQGTSDRTRLAEVDERIKEIERGILSGQIRPEDD